MFVRKCARWTVMGSIAVLAACGGAPDSESTPPPTSSADQELFWTTVVTQNEDGTEEVYSYQLTAAEMRAELEARQAMVDALASGKVQQPISQDTGCAGPSMWLYDGTYLTGNRICFRYSGAANLNNYGWGTKVRSYYSGESGGSLDNNAAVICCADCTSFTTYQRVDVASSCEQAATALGLAYCTPC